jgi:glycosyltransferase involved in cell wall biosynthesis
MVICKIWDADYPWDVRVEKMCQSLRQKHEVHLVCRNTKGRRTYEEADGIHIHRLPFLHLGSAWLNKVLGFPAFFNPLWIITVWRVVRRYRADLILVRDLPLALAALLVGRWQGIPVVMDMAENYPAMLQDRLNFGPVMMLSSFIRNPAIARVVERVTLRLMDHTIVVVEESLDRLIETGVPRNQLSVVGNTPRVDRWQVSRSLKSARDQYGLELVYLGNLDSSRGVDVAIRAVDYLSKIGCSVRMTVIGDGPWIQRLRNLVTILNAGDRILIAGRLPFAEVEAIMTRAHIGIIPHYVTDAWNSTIPNKLFDYMSMGKAVIVSNARPAERIVREENCGLVFSDRDPKSLADAIVQLSDAGVREALGKRGREAVIGRYNWSVDEEELFQAIEKAVQTRNLVECAES